MNNYLDSKIKIANKEFSSRLIVGTGKYSSYKLNQESLEASGAEIVTVAIRRVNLADKNIPKLTDFTGQKNIPSCYYCRMLYCNSVKDS